MIMVTIPMASLDKSAWYNQFYLSNQFSFSHEQLQQDMDYKNLVHSVKEKRSLSGQTSELYQ
jgi:hypothetical protein